MKSVLLLFVVVGVIKIIVSILKGGRRQGRQRKRWEDNIREWTGLEGSGGQGKMEETGC